MDTRESKIIIEIVEPGQKDAGVEKDIPGSNDDAKKQTGEEQEKSLSKTLGAMTLASLKATALKGLNVSVNRYFSLSENYMAENDFSNFKSTINGLGRITGSITTFASVGFSINGPTGAAVGAIAGAIAGTANEGMNAYQRTGSYYQSINATRYQTEFDRTRMGLTNEGKGTEN